MKTKNEHKVLVELGLKKTYVSPVFQVSTIEMETSIATGSANIDPGTPNVDDWNDGGSTGGSTPLDF